MRPDHPPPDETFSREALLDIFRNGTFKRVTECVEELQRRDCLDNEVLDAQITYICRTIRHKNLKKFSKSFFYALVPSESVAPSTTLNLILWAFKVNQESCYLMVFQWVICLLKYSLISLEGIAPLYEILLHRLVVMSPGVAPYLLKILLRITVFNEVTKWRIEFLKLKSFNSYAQELLNRYRILKPDLFDTSDSFYTGKSLVKVNWRYYYDKKNEFDLKFAKYWDSKRRDYHESLLSENALFEASTLNIFEPHRLNICELTVYRNENGLYNIFNCFTMRQFYANIHNMTVPDRSLCILDSPQLYLFLLVRKDSREILERFSLALYDKLVNDFIETEANVRELQNTREKNASFLRKIFRLQSFFQESLPVVNKFLSEYFSYNWDGESYFLEILQLISHIQITDFDELFDCILSPIHSHYVNSFSFPQKLSMLSIVKELIVFWIQSEVPRITLDSQKPTVFPRANLTHINPYSSLLEITSFFRSLVDLGFDQCAQDRDFFLNEIFMMYKMITKVVINNRIPLKPEPPISFGYISLCSTNPLILSNLMEFIILLRKEILPICKEIATSTSENSNCVKIAAQQIRDSEFLNTLTKDILAVISIANVHLNRNQSLFKQQCWQIDDEKYRNQLNIISHIAFLGNSSKFVEKYSREHKVNVQSVVQDLYNRDSDVYNAYLLYLEAYFPHIVEFLRIFEAPKKKSFFNSTVVSSSSGVSSMSPKTISKRRSRRVNKKY
uniref:Centromere protein I [Gallus gallus] n=1 Tax=Lepeophtheirus salmonis TaxID=72036 RepID=A0A0K2TK23_LEPSM